jgi:LuxR family maltose regulon positive regulatory protein
MAGAQETLELLSQYDVDMLGYETASALAARAELQYLQGDMMAAGRWVDAFNESVPDQPLLSTHAAHITKARLLLARGAVADVQTAQAIIAALYSIAERTCNTRSMIALEALRALALAAEGQERAAQVSLQEAVEMAQPGGFIRTFVDLGPPMQALLERLAGQDGAPAHVHCILAAFPVALPAAFPVPAELGPQPPSRGGEPLTTRELDVLTLMRRRLSAKEIARELGIAPMTVNRHAANLYDKLDVNTRWDAVAKAEELGILPTR